MLALAAALTGATPAVTAAIPAAAQTVTWVEPVDAPVIDGYRPPAHVGAPGNRGWEYLTDPGTVVVAAGDGVVAFAGPIGGSVYVSIRHRDGHRTTYSHVASISVDVGDTVVAGAPIATSGERLHFGVRVGADYRDPGALFAPSTPDAAGVATPDGLRLVPPSDRARFGITRSFTPIPDLSGMAQRTGLGSRSSPVDALRPDGAGVAQGWSGAATDTLAGDPQHRAVGP